MPFTMAQQKLFQLQTFRDIQLSMRKELLILKVCLNGWAARLFQL